MRAWGFRGGAGSPLGECLRIGYLSFLYSAMVLKEVAGRHIVISMSFVDGDARTVVLDCTQVAFDPEEGDFESHQHLEQWFRLTEKPAMGKKSVNFS